VTGLCFAAVTAETVPVDSPCLSVVVPCFNEEASVERAVGRVLAQPFVAEVVVVDDASTDGTAAILRTLDDPRVRVVTHPVNRGKGAALRTGFAQARGPFVAVQDADLEYDPADLAKLLVPLQAGDADVVYGSRFLTSDAHRVLYFWHSVGNRVLTLYSNMLTNLNLTDMETCYKVFRREVLDRITIEEDRFGVEPELTAKVAALGCRIYEVGISYHGRSYAEGKKIGWKDGVRAMWVMSRYRAWTRSERRRATRQPSIFDDADAELAGTLETLDGADRYVEWIASLVVPNLRGRVLEVGAGHGTFSAVLAGAASELVVSEPSERASELLRERFAGHPGIRVISADLEAAAAEGPFDGVVLLNVLEHIADDEKALAQIHDLLAPGGRAVVFVPAFEALYSAYDKSIGHHRRYRRTEVVRKAERAGLRVVDARYVNAIGFFGWLTTAKLLRTRPTQTALVERYDRLAVPLARAIESRARPPFGQSVLLVAERP
jgi:glycosyltransferase involved in cell wall biosynthesis